MLYKILWALRALCYKPFFGNIGFLSYIGKPIYLSNVRKVYIGNKVRIFPGARIEVVNTDSSINFDDNISIGQNLHITSGGKLQIKKGTTIAGNVTITNIDHEYKLINVSIVKQQYIVKETIIGENCYIGKGAMIQAGTILGKQCIVGANAVARGHFPDYCVIAGIPAKILKKYNSKSGLWEKA